MAKPNPNFSSSIDSNSGFCSESKIYHSLRPNAPLPPETIPLSLTNYIFSLLQQQTSPSPETSTTTAAALIDATTNHRIPYSELILRTKTLATYLHRTIGLEKGDSALILSLNSTHIPILYLSLLSIGVVISPSNPTNSISEISRQIELSKPVIAFATSETAHKVSPLRYRTIILDSPEFQSITTSPIQKFHEIEVFQSDPAAIFYSSGTTGKFKGVVLTHRNCISVLAAAHAVRPVGSSMAVSLCAVPYFHTYGFVYCVRAMSMGQSVVSMQRFDLRLMMRSIEEFRVMEAGVAPPVVVAMVNNYDHVMDGYDLRYLKVLSSSGATLPMGVIEKFMKRFPSVQLVQGYGLTEASGGVSRTIGPNESKVLGASGRLMSNCQAKIVDPESTGSGLPPFQLGELWVRGPFIMKGYIGDEEATAAIIDSNEWLKTGDLCYFDNQGFLYFVDRIKDLIKYKAYQVAPAELEDLLQSHPDIVEAAVIPYPDEEAGQVPMAFLVRRSGSIIDESQIKNFINKQVAPYKKIRRVSFVTSIPKNATGKVLRKELVKLVLSSATSKL